MRALALLCSLLALGCSERPPAPTARLAAGRQEAAAARVRGFLSAYQRADVEEALSFLCEPDAASRAFLERSLSPSSPFRIQRFELGGVTPLWEKDQPLYLVGARFPGPHGATREHAYRVRAREGCIERLVPVAAGHAPSLPEAGAADAPGPPLPSAEREGVLEEPASEGAWGPALPAAPTSQGDEVIDL